MDISNGSIPTARDVFLSGGACDCGPRGAFVAFRNLRQVGQVLGTLKGLPSASLIDSQYAGCVLKFCSQSGARFPLQLTRTASGASISSNPTGCVAGSAAELLSGTCGEAGPTSGLSC